MKLKDILIYITTEMFAYYIYFKKINLQINAGIILDINNLLLLEYLRLYSSEDNVESVDILSSHIGKRYILNDDIDCIKLFLEIDEELKYFIPNIKINNSDCVISINLTSFDSFEINHYSIINIFDNYYANMQ